MGNSSLTHLLPKSHDSGKKSLFQWVADVSFLYSLNVFNLYNLPISLSQKDVMLVLPHIPSTPSERNMRHRTDLEMINANVCIRTHLIIFSPPRNIYNEQIVTVITEFEKKNSGSKKQWKDSEKQCKKDKGAYCLYGHLMYTNARLDARLDNRAVGMKIGSWTPEQFEIRRWWHFVVWK